MILSFDNTGARHRKRAIAFTDQEIANRLASHWVIASWLEIAWVAPNGSRWISAPHSRHLAW